MKNTSKVVLSTLLASAVLGGSNFASANEDKVTTPVVDDKPVTVVDKADKVEKETPKVNGAEENKVEKETPKVNGVEDSKADELNKNETSKVNTDFNKVVDNATTKQELKSVVNSTDKLTEGQKQDLSEKVENAQNQEQLKEVKELAKTGTTTSVFATVLGFLAMASAFVLRKFKRENI